MEWVKMWVLQVLLRQSQDGMGQDVGSASSSLSAMSSKALRVIHPIAIG